VTAMEPVAVETKVVAMPASSSTIAASLTADWRQARHWLYRGFRAHCIMVAIVLVHVAAATLLPLVLGLNERFVPDYGNTFIRFAGLAAVVFLLSYAIIVMVTVRPKRLIRYMVADLSSRCLTPERLAMALPVLLFLPLLVSAFSYFKMAIPDLQPFSWDPLLAEFDRRLHGGYHPWEWLQPVFGHPWMTAAINGAYHLWFGVTYGVLLWQTVDIRRPKLRMRYLITFVLLWIVIGNVAATLFSSVGPVYYGRVTGLADPFAPLMEYLRHANEVAAVPALDVQELLWRVYTTGGGMTGGGISAMPSMHMASAFSFVLIGAATNRWLGAAFTAFAALVLIGSVHLGWHYAVDGYVSIAATLLIWRAVGWMLERRGVAWLLWGDSMDAKLDIRRA